MDYLIKNANIADGTGSQLYKADVLISEGIIKKIDKVIEGEAQGDRLTVINADGKLLTPGFIDVHRHADAAVFREGFGEIELRQGLTTIINGNCGLSIVPCPEKCRAELYDFLSPVTGECTGLPVFSDFYDYMECIPKELPLNVGMLIGNGTVRTAVSGYRSGKLDDDEIKQVHRYISKALSDGAYGVSIGLQYAPEYNYDVNDLKKVLMPMSGYNAPLCTHTRGDGDGLFQALDEVTEIAGALDIQLQISHFKNMGKRNWGERAVRALEYLDRARERGLNVNTDVYPYTYGSTQLIHIMPTELLEGGMAGVVEKLRDKNIRSELTKTLKSKSDSFENLYELLGWENFYLTTFSTEENQKYTGLSVPEIARMRNQDEFECVYDLLVEEKGKIGMIDYLASEEDVRTFMKYKHALYISDSTYPTRGLPHPRVYGTFARILATYVRDEKVVAVEEAIRKMSGMPADIFHINNKGYIREGYDADINIFDIKNIDTKAEPTDSKQLATGFDYVFVGGEPAVISDKVTGSKKGRKLFR